MMQIHKLVRGDILSLPSSRHLGFCGPPRYVLFTATRYSDVMMGAMASQITSVSIVYSTACSGADQRKHQSSASLAFVRGINRWPMNPPHKGPVTQKMFPFDDVIMATFSAAAVKGWPPTKCLYMGIPGSYKFLIILNDLNICRDHVHITYLYEFSHHWQIVLIHL